MFNGPPQADGCEGAPRFFRFSGGTGAVGADRSKTSAYALAAWPRQGQAPRSFDPVVRLRGMNMRKSVAGLKRPSELSIIANQRQPQRELA